VTFASEMALTLTLSRGERGPDDTAMVFIEGRERYALAAPYRRATSSQLTVFHQAVT
jgi:hypothetical protein